MSDSSVTPWTVTHQAPLSMSFPRQAYWSGLPFTSPGDLPDPGIKPESLTSPALAGRLFPIEPPGKPSVCYYKIKNRADSWTLREKARAGCFERTASKHVYYLGWNRSPAQAGCMRQVLGPGALGRPRGSGWRGRWERGSGWGIHVKPWLILVNVWQKPLQYCKVISLQLIKINEKK